MGYIMALRQMVGTRPLIMAGACVVVIDNQEPILLQLRLDNGLWGWPGGSFEPGNLWRKSREGDLLDVFSGMDLYYQYPHGDEAGIKDLKFFPVQALPSEISPPDWPVIRRFLNLQNRQKTIDEKRTVEDVEVIFYGSNGGILKLSMKAYPAIQRTYDLKPRP